MASFTYQGRDKSGQLIKGDLEASSSEVVAMQLAGRGIVPVAIKERKIVQDSGFSLEKLLGPEKVKTEDLIMFSRQMYTITKAGIPLIRGFRGLITSMRHPTLKTVLGDIVDRLETGMELSTAMRMHPKVFGSLYVSMVHVGENSGRLEQVFDQMSTYLQRDLTTSKDVKAALRYPTFVVSALGVGVAVVNVLVVPAFAQMFQQFGADLPLPTRILIGLSDFFVNYWYLLLMALGLGFYGAREYLKTHKGQMWWGEVKLHLPIFGGIIERGSMARYARSFSLMLGSGVPLSHSLDLCANAMDNAFLAKKIRGIRQGIERGDSLISSHTASDMFSPLVLQMVAVGEESGQVDALLAEVAEFYEQEVDYDLKSLSAKIEPIMIILLAGFVLILALGIFLPMWEMYNVQSG